LGRSLNGMISFVEVVLSQVSRSRPGAPGELVRVGLVEVEDFLEGEHVFVGVASGFEEGSHLELPAGVDGLELHEGLCAGEVVGFKIADQKAIGAEKQRVVAPAGAAKGVEHLGPDSSVATFVFVEQVGADLEEEADAHKTASSY
jgi:hypothetical protein